jgi:lactate dehydrogenase-like 2-hydroxyacid dehydrogenase
VPTYGSNTVAEHVFGLLLVISHKLEQAIDRTSKRAFNTREAVQRILDVTIENIRTFAKGQPINVVV